ncbi:glycosyltransferase family 4 protein [Advenella alkanexedens]|uniref:Glycosyltransferase family 4 protein n=1 Tax=Advenella alkanexedens TaxID=1481665 RepID=A0ABS6NKU4_9BURK|nr:glycosyltransferase family 1 protein [Advenella alkanexedens]MBV4396247.1 glycosyltransferase family 4 protein [Advenella alkanexedens]
MKVILNVEPIRFPLTGIGRYTYELAKALRTSSCIDELKLFSATRFLQELPQSDLKDNPVHGLKRVVQKSYLAMEAYRLLMPWLRSKALRKHGDYIYHSPNFFLPVFPGRKVATFHDLSPFTWSECHDPVKVRYLQKELRTTLHRADRLITDSEFTRCELAEFSGLAMDKIHAVPLASAPEFQPYPEVDLQPLLKRYQLEYQGYSLFVGTIEPRKNIVTLLDAYARLPVSVRRQWPLILTGYKGWQSEAIHARIKDAERQGWARYLGFLPAEDLPGLYAGARLFAFPSLYEGFGLPVLEAMSSGVPVVCSDSSSLPEVVGSAALMCAPMDVETLAMNLLKGLEDNIWRTQAVTQGLQRSAGFSWERCAQETIAVYQKL